MTKSHDYSRLFSLGKRRLKNNLTTLVLDEYLGACSDLRVPTSVVVNGRVGVVSFVSPGVLFCAVGALPRVELNGHKRDDDQGH